LENVVLTVRVYATDRNDIAERVAVATNSQARIQSRDLYANHSALKKMEIAFADRGYFFERKRNMHSDRDAKQRIDALKLGQIIVSFYLQEPDKARSDSDTIFGARFPAIFHEQYNMDELCKLVELYRTIEEMKDAYIARHGQRVGADVEQLYLSNGQDGEDGGEQQYLIYGHWFILYASRLLLVHSNRPIPTKNEARKLVMDAIRLVARACSNQGKPVAHYQMFRSPRTRDKIWAELRGKQLDLFDLLAALPD
jgi:hypothetical protein